MQRLAHQAQEIAVQGGLDSRSAPVHGPVARAVFSPPDISV